MTTLYLDMFSCYNIYHHCLPFFIKGLKLEIFSDKWVTRNHNKNSLTKPNGNKNP